MSDSTPKLRLAQPESAEQIAKRLEREQIAMNRDREFALEQSLGGFRVGSVRALNAVPLTRGRRTQVWEATITDAAGRLVATGRVRLLCLEPGSDLAGKTVPERRTDPFIPDAK